MGLLQQPSHLYWPPQGGQRGAAEVIRSRIGRSALNSPSNGPVEGGKYASGIADAAYRDMISRDTLSLLHPIPQLAKIAERKLGELRKATCTENPQTPSARL
jgi:hypothetical protein